MKKVRFIYNPSSGETLISEYLDHIITIYQNNGYIMSLFRLTFSYDPKVMVEDIDDSYAHVLIAGGDGTINYVVNALKENNIDIPIAVLSTGTANDFASLLNTPADILKACRAIIAGTEDRIDIGRVNDEYFVNVFSCGLFTEVSQKTPTVFKNTFGKLAYYFSGIQELPNFRKFHIDLKSNNGDYEGSSLVFFVFNGRTAGGVHIARLSEVNDGMLDILIVEGDSPILTIGRIVRFLNLPSKKRYPKGVRHIQCSELSLNCHGVYTSDIDGQPGPRFPVKITCEKNGLRIIRPKVSRTRSLLHSEEAE